MDKKFEGKPVVRDIEICRKCGCLKRVNDPIVENDGWHWGVVFTAIISPNEL